MGVAMGLLPGRSPAIRVNSAVANQQKACPLSTSPIHHSSIPPYSAKVLFLATTLPQMINAPTDTPQSSAPTTVPRVVFTGQAAIIAHRRPPPRDDGDGEPIPLPTQGPATMLRPTTLLCTCSALALFAGARAETIILAADGRPSATIVLPADAHARLEAAATELRDHVRLICGVELPLHRDGRAVPGAGLYIGQCGIATDDDLPARNLNPETYAIRVRDGNILFSGRWPTPTYFAVISFIEDALGVRWFAPGDLWTHVPAGTPGRLQVDVKETVKEPGTSPRVWSGHQWFPNWKTWNLRNKTVLSEVVPRRQFQNHLHRVFPPATYAEAHPEYYPLIDGKRWIPPKGGGYWRPCESDPDVRRLTVEYARKWFDARPTTDSFSVGMDDISHLCSCPGCRALDPRPDSYEKKEFSDRHYAFVNAIAREIGASHPDRYVGTLIYNIARVPPETVGKLEDNVFGFITETSALWWQEGRKEEDQALSREWAKRCKHLSRYDYYGMGTFTPRVYPHAMDEQIKFDKSLGFEGMYVEVYTFPPHTAPMIWALARLQWDHTLDVDDLLGEFYARMYGRAAPVMKQYFDLLERSWNTPRAGRTGWVHRNIVRQALAMDPADVDAGMGLLERAMTAAQAPQPRKRIEIHRAALRFAGYAIRAYALSEQIVTTPVTDEAAAREVLRDARELARLAAEREVFWAEARERKDLLGESIRGLADKIGYLQTGKVTQLEHGGFAGTTRALAWLTDHAPDALNEALQELASSRGGSLAETIGAWLWVREHSPPSVLKNGDFEDTTENTQSAEKDWKSRGAPNGWSTWSRTTAAALTQEPGRGRGGSVAASITGAESACFLNTCKAQPGEVYLCVCWLRCDPPRLQAGPRLSIRFRTPDGAWHKRSDFEPTVNGVEGEAGWQPVVLRVQVPEGAGSVLVMPGAGSQEEGAAVLFDDIALYRLPDDSE